VSGVLVPMPESGPALTPGRPFRVFLGDDSVLWRSASVRA
jgi:hypothetical protein